MRPHVTPQVPRDVDFLQLAENNRQFEGVIPTKELARLHGVLNSTESEVAVKLNFGWKFGIRSLTGSVSANLELLCQRCLNPIMVTIESQFCFALIETDDEIEDLPDDIEPYVIEGELQSVEDVIIDEILLSIPLVAKHEEACSDYLSDHTESVDTKTHKPFASIKDLLN